jgi:hypothetical protein
MNESFDQLPAWHQLLKITPIYTPIILTSLVLLIVHHLSSQRRRAKLHPLAVQQIARLDRYCLLHDKNDYTKELYDHYRSKLSDYLSYNASQFSMALWHNWHNPSDDTLAAALYHLVNGQEARSLQAQHGLYHHSENSTEQKTHAQEILLHAHRIEQHNRDYQKAQLVLALTYLIGTALATYALLHVQDGQPVI